MYGEKVEETDELRMDVTDLKQMYRQLLQEHVDTAAAQSSRERDRERQASTSSQQSHSVLGALRPSQQQAKLDLAGGGSASGGGGRMRGEASSAAASGGSSKSSGPAALSKSFADWELEG